MPRITLTCTETGFVSSDEADLSGLITLGACAFRCDGSVIIFDPEDEAQKTELPCKCGETFVIDTCGIVFYGEAKETLH